MRKFNSFISTIFRLTAMLLALTVPVGAANPAWAADIQEGRDYRVISPALDSPKGKIEVIEFFSYGCPHCREISPLIEKWVANLPKDVSFRRVPITFNKPAWARLAKLYYALESTGNLAKLDDAVFRAIHDERVNWSSDEALIAWATGKGVDGKKFGDALNSFSMQSRVQRADQDASSARIPGVPALVVDGKFLLNNDAADGYPPLLKLTDGVIAKARLDRKTK